MDTSLLAQIATFLGLLVVSLRQARASFETQRTQSQLESSLSTRWARAETKSDQLAEELAALQLRMTQQQHESEIQLAIKQGELSALTKLLSTTQDQLREAQVAQARAQDRLDQLIGEMKAVKAELTSIKAQQGELIASSTDNARRAAVAEAALADRNRKIAALEKRLGAAEERIRELEAAAQQVAHSTSVILSDAGGAASAGAASSGGLSGDSSAGQSGAAGG